MNHILEVEHVLLERGLRRVLTGVFLKCETGEVTGMLGRNGSGKSCLLKIIYGELQAKESSIRIDGQALSGRKRDCLDMRFLPQGHFIPGHLTLRRVFADFGNQWDDFVHFFPDFQAYYTSRMRRLSGGERRIVEIYTILQATEKFCLLDEPFAQVMPLHIDVLKRLIRRASETKGVVLTDHSYHEVMSVSDKVYVLSAGKSVLVRNAEDLKRLGYIHEDKR